MKRGGDDEEIYEFKIFGHHVCSSCDGLKVCALFSPLSLQSVYSFSSSLLVFFSYFNMALYTPQSLPHTPPPSYNMNVALPPLPVELLATLSNWRNSTPHTPLTPPDTVASSRRVLHHRLPQKTTLPPIACFYRDLSRPYPRTSRLTMLYML